MEELMIMKKFLKIELMSFKKKQCLVVSTLKNKINCLEFQRKDQKKSVFKKLNKLLKN